MHMPELTPAQTLLVSVCSLLLITYLIAIRYEP